MLKVVVVEDEEFVRKGIILTIDWEAMGCQIAGEASDGKSGLDLIRFVKPDIIIIDIRMPYMTGIEMLTQLRSEGNNVQAVILTAYSDFSYAQKAVKLGAADYLLKPFHDEELETVIKRLAEKCKKSDTPVLSEKMLPEEKRIQDSLQKVYNAGSQSKYIMEIISYIANNYANSDISIQSIADSLKLSQSHLSHTFKNETGTTLSDYLTKYRMLKAIELLHDCRNRIGEVSEAVGYRDLTYFSYLFKKEVGVSPSAFQGK